MCVQTEGFFLILDEKFILTPTVPADASYLEIKREKTWKFMTSWGIWQFGRNLSCHISASFDRVAGALLYKSPGSNNEQSEEVTHRQNSEQFLYIHSLRFYKLIYDMATRKKYIHILCLH